MGTKVESGCLLDGAVCVYYSVAVVHFFPFSTQSLRRSLYVQLLVALQRSGYSSCPWCLAQGCGSVRSMIWLLTRLPVARVLRVTADKAKVMPTLKLQDKGKAFSSSKKFFVVHLK